MFVLSDTVQNASLALYIQSSTRSLFGKYRDKFGTATVMVEREILKDREKYIDVIEMLFYKLNGRKF